MKWITLLFESWKSSSKDRKGVIGGSAGLIVLLQIGISYVDNKHAQAIDLIRRSDAAVREKIDNSNKATQKQQEIILKQLEKLDNRTWEILREMRKTRKHLEEDRN